MPGPAGSCWPFGKLLKTLNSQWVLSLLGWGTLHCWVPVRSPPHTPPPCYGRGGGGGTPTTSQSERLGSRARLDAAAPMRPSASTRA